MSSDSNAGATKSISKRGGVTVKRGLGWRYEQGAPTHGEVCSIWHLQSSDADGHQ
jgi:hypothetical protein